ncbi:hypothetical protein [Oryza sativa Japonica Group]|uniref:Uncharacterized protein n=2 Tax=Oryza sativa subsp. japonica TaxID=39947 RepID=Q5ZBY1_ORYSJ|nr:hypothetical protein [Oryza sativa Japonica Group]BAD53386.1 hypothetical protein [Oryza sativa Japonica Group]
MARAAAASDGVWSAAHERSRRATPRHSRAPPTPGATTPPPSAATPPAAEHPTIHLQPSI